MISQQEYDQFLLRVKEEKDATVVGVSPSNFSIEVQERQDAEKGKVVRKLVFSQNSDVYDVSDRAKNNILKLSGFTGKLLKELPVNKINDSLNYQLSKRASYGITRKSGILYSLFDTDAVSYHPYDALLVPKENLIKVSGNPLTSDFIEFQTTDQTLDRSGQLVVGMNALVSSTGMTRSKFSYGVMRVVCTNGWVDSLFDVELLPFVSNELVASMYDLYKKKMGDFVTKLNSFVDGAEKFEVLNITHLEDLFTHLSCPPKIKQTVYGCLNREISEASSQDLLLKNAGVSGIKTLWDVFQVLLWLSNHAPSLKQSIGMGKNVFKWADQLLVSQN